MNELTGDGCGAQLRAAWLKTASHRRNPRSLFLPASFFEQLPHHDGSAGG